MTRFFTLCCLAVALMFGAASFAQAQTTGTKARKATRVVVSPYPVWRGPRVTVSKRYTGTPGYGFLPGYRPPSQRPLYGPQDTYDYPGTYPWYGGPQYYRGRLNGGGFGPCYTKTPIGPMWNCG